MYLSKLEILGFKSFAKKTEFNFKGGITGIVGPNGCGKSNIVDAIRWVLGEQKAGALRSERMENVIFNGSRSQKPLGLAEVSLTIQNTRNILPIEYSEVVITRRLFRSGESQYLLNNSTCRLKDIMNLFMDTGMGANAYSVIELAMVEQILNGKAEERRHIFEEAAGVGKYKSRRKAAFRKLEATEADIVRLNDVISEVEKNVASLKRQVQKAKRYQKYSDELRDVELEFSVRQLATIDDELNPLEQELKVLHDRREEISAIIGTEEAEIEELKLKVLEIEKQLVARQRDLNANTERIQKKEEDILVSQERSRSVKEKRERYLHEVDDLKKRAEMLAEMQTSLGNRVEEMKQGLAELEGELKQEQNSLDARRQAFEAKRQELRQAESAQKAEAETISQLHQERERLRTQAELTGQRLAELQTAKEQLTQQHGECEAAREEMTGSVGQALAVLDQLNVDVEDIQSEISSKQTKIDELKQSISDRSNEIKRHQDRVELLQRFLENYEDYPEGVKHFLLGDDANSGYLGTLGDKIHVDEKYRTAVEAALDDAVVALLVDHPDRAYDGVQALRQAEKGAVTFLPVNGGRSSNSLSEPAALSDARIIGNLLDFVHCDQQVKELLGDLIGTCYVVNELQDARALAAGASSGRISFVTLQGDWVANWGPIRGGQSSNGDNSLIGRREQIEALEDEIGRLDGDMDQLITDRERAEAELRSLLGRNEELTKRKKESENHRQKLEIEFGQAVFQVKKAVESIAKNEEEQTELTARQEKLTQELSSVEGRLQQVESKKQTAESSHDEMRQEIEALEQALREEEKKTNEVNLRVVEARAELRNTESERERIANNIRELEENRTSRLEEIGSAEQQEEELKKHLEEVQELLQEEFADRQELEDLVQGLEETFRENKTTVDDKERELRPRRKERDEVSERLHKVELRISELKMRRENLNQHIREAYELDLVSYSRQHPVSLEVEFDKQATEERIDWLRNRLKSMGPVNMLALADYEKENERFEFLVTQRDDLLNAEENLKETIKVINDTAYERFGKIFSLIRENFIQVFQSFFEGGMADLRLAEGDPLEADIIIEANPKGKKLGSLALLSGGEKTLTAISLLFAIYLVKPSPFCILDEVDAPLDDNNINRFAGAIRKFSEKTQFICVTHNKGTMREADYLYGITMQEHGISKVVSVKFDDPDQTNGATASSSAAQTVN